tara:strand:+ start:2822 stop:3100 length:279 start_codon:yes stop_codon:yes gene_type:complete
MSQINEVYPNIENPEGLNAPDIVSEKTSYIFPVSGPEPQQPDHYVTKKYYEENISSASRDSNGYGTRFISTTTETPAVGLGTDGDIYYYCGE